MTSHPAVASPPRRTRRVSPQKSPTRPGATIWFALAAVYILWGSTYLAIRVVTQSLPAFGSAAIRFAVAGMLLLLVVAALLGWRSVRVTRRELAAVALVGVLLLAGGNGLIVLAESPRFGLPSGVAALVASLNPLVLVVLRFVTGDRARLMTLLGVLVGLAGLVVLFLPGTGVTSISLAGGLLATCAVLCWAGASFATRWLPMPASPFVASVYEMLAGSAAMTIIAVVLREPAPWAVPHVPARAWWALAYLVVAGSLVAFTAFVYLLQHAPISLVSTYAYVNPVIALLLGAAFVGEALTGRVVLAGGIVLLGVVLVVSTERPRLTPR